MATQKRLSHGWKSLIDALLDDGGAPPLQVRVIGSRHDQNFPGWDLSDDVLELLRAIDRERCRVGRRLTLLEGFRIARDTCHWRKA